MTVETVMKDPAYRITADTIEEALKQMKGFKEDYGYVVSDEGYQGIVTKETLKEAYAEDKSAELTEEHYETVDPIAQDAVLETVIPDTLDADYSLPVVDEEGNLTGQLSRSTLAEVLGSEEESAKDTAEAQSESDKNSAQEEQSKAS